MSHAQYTWSSLSLFLGWCAKIATKNPHLFISPLRPKIESQSSSNGGKSEHEEQPEKTINDVEIAVKDVADAMDGASACVFCCCLSQTCLL